MVWDLDTIVRKNDAVCKVEATEEATPLAKVGDWVRSKASNGVVGDPFQVEHVDGSAVWEKSVYRHQHGRYEILRRVVRPWTFAEACVAFANAGMKVHSSFVYEVVDVAADGITIGSGRHRDRFTFRDIAGLFALSNGEPCGVVEWVPADGPVSSA